MITQHQKVEIIHRNRDEANALAQSIGWAIEGNCLLTSISLTVALQEEFGLNAVLMAGSASWPRIDLAKDDGKIMTHFSYVFEEGMKTMIDLVVHHRLPEMHCWVAIVDDKENKEIKEIIDPTTCYLKRQCERLTGMKWEAPEPPDFIWCSPESKNWPKGVYYFPSYAAYVIAKLAAADLMDNYESMRAVNACRNN